MYRALPTLDWLFLFLVQLLTLKHCCGNTQTLCHHLKKKEEKKEGNTCLKPFVLHLASDRSMLVVIVFVAGFLGFCSYACQIILLLFLFCCCFFLQATSNMFVLPSCFQCLTLFFPLLSQTSLLFLRFIGSHKCFLFSFLGLTSLIKRLLLFGLKKKKKFSCQPVCFICHYFFGCPDSTIDTHNPI